MQCKKLCQKKDGQSLQWKTPHCFAWFENSEIYKKGNNKDTDTKEDELEEEKCASTNTR